jgi:hypothetical protein
MNDNTILRIKVPAHLYESVKEQLTLTEAKKGGKTYGDWTVVKEKKLSKDGMKQVEEMKDDKKNGHSLEELKAAHKKLSSKIQEMESAPKEDIKEYVGMSPDEMKAMEILGTALAGTAAGAAIISQIKNFFSKEKGDKKPMDDKEVGGMEEAKEKKLNEASLELDWASGIASLKKKCEKHGLTFKVVQEKGPAGENPLVKINGPKDKIILFLKDGYADADQLEDYTADIKGN